MIFDADALAVIVAALDGHDPRTTTTEDQDGTVTITTTGSQEPRDVDLTADDLLELFSPRHAVVDVATAAHAVITATALTLGHAPAEVDTAEVARLLRSWIRTSREGEAVIQHESEDS